MGIYYLDEWSNTNDTLADFTAISVLGLLDTVTHMGGVYDTTFEALAAELLAGHDHEIAPELSGIPIKGYLPIGTRRTSLQQLCMAAGAVVDSSRSDKIQLFPPPVRPGVYIGRDRIFMGDTVTLRPLVTAVEVTAHTYTAGEAGKNLCKEVITPGSYRLTFDAPMHGYTITGGVITARANNYVDFDVAAAGEVVLTGKEYIVSRSVIRRMAANIPANAEQNVLKVEQATLVSPELAEGVAQRLLNYHSKRCELAFKTCLLGEHPADIGIVEALGSNKVRGAIERLFIDLAGGYRADVVVVGERLDATWQYYCGDELYCGEEAGVI